MNFSSVENNNRELDFAWEIELYVNYFHLKLRMN